MDGSVEGAELGSNIRHLAPYAPDLLLDPASHRGELLANLASHGGEPLAHLASRRRDFPAHVFEPGIALLVEVSEPLVGPGFPCHRGHDSTVADQVQRVVRAA